METEIRGHQVNLDDNRPDIAILKPGHDLEYAGLKGVQVEPAQR
jgi:hypothetical protein